MKSRAKSDAIQQSVFASADQSAPFTAARQAKHALPGRSKAKSFSGNMRRGNSKEAIQSPPPQSISRGGGTYPSPDVEQAEEAQEAVKNRNKSTRQQNVDRHESPTDEISEKASRLVSGTRELFQGSRLKRQERSGSQSPKRRGSRRRGGGYLSGSDTGSPSPASDRSRASSRGSQGRGISVGRGRSESCPSPTSDDGMRLVDSPVGLYGRSPSMRGGSADNIMDSPRIRRSSSRDSACPKTLTPAQAPTVSLVTSCDVDAMNDGINISAIDSPKLLPPVAASNITRLNSGAQKELFTEEMEAGKDLEEVSREIEAIESETNETLDDVKNLTGIPVDKEEMKHLPAALSKVALSKTPPTLGESDTTADLSKIERVTEQGQSATDQLSRLAQTAQEEYRSMGEQDGECMELRVNKEI